MIGALRRRAATFVLNCRRHGIPATLRGAWQTRFGRGRMTLQLLGLSRPNALPPPVQSRIEARFASPADVDGLAASGQLQRDSPALLAAGDACLLQFVDGRLAGWAWLSSREEVELYPGLFLKIPADAGYVFRTWTVPEMRGHGLQPRRTLALLEECRRRGRHRLVCFVESTNLASLKGVAKAGYERVALLRWTAPPGGRRHARLRVESPEWRELAVRVEAGPARP